MNCGFLVDKILEEDNTLDKEEIHQDIQEAWDDKRFLFIKTIGFLTWLEKEKYNRRCIFINNLWVEKEHRYRGNLLFLRKVLRNKYPNAMFYWHKRSTDEFKYF